MLPSYKRNFEESKRLAAEFVSTQQSALPPLRKIQNLNANPDLGQSWHIGSSKGQDTLKFALVNFDSNKNQKHTASFTDEFSNELTKSKKSN